MKDPLTLDQTHPCPCGSRAPYADCCGIYHKDHARVPTAEALMRSRYSAFARRNFDYIVATQHPDYRGELSAASLRQDPPVDWLGLEILETKQAPASGYVSFKAWYKQQGKLDVIFESSRFLLEDGLWYYLDGEQMTCPLPKRNQTCICHSGKKFKHCCMP